MQKEWEVGWGEIHSTGQPHGHPSTESVQDAIEMGMERRRESSPEECACAISRVGSKDLYGGEKRYRGRMWARGLYSSKTALAVFASEGKLEVEVDF